MDNFLSFIVEEWLLFAIAALLLGLITRSFFIARLTGVSVVNPNEAIRVINDEALILDVRLEKEFKQAHIKNAINIPVGALESRMRELDKQKSGPTLICCQTSSRSMLAGKTLRKHGFDKISVLSGGLNAWANANLPTETGNKRDENKDKEKGKKKKKNKHKNKNQEPKNGNSELAVLDTKTDADADFASTKSLDNSADELTQNASSDSPTDTTAKENPTPLSNEDPKTEKDADLTPAPVNSKS